MGIFKTSIKVASEILTLGGAGLLEASKISYQKTYEEYLSIYKEIEFYKNQINSQLSKLGISICKTKPYIEYAERLLNSKFDKSQEGDFRDLSKTITLEKIERFNSGFSTAVNTTAGSIAGGSLAVGSWVLVGTLGSATTGTAISGLAGVAATNATLAWFGGGALAAGGAGMAGGAVVLGGILVAPLMFLAVRGTYKKAAEVDAEKKKLEIHINSLREQLKQCPKILSTVEQKKCETEILCDNFVAEISGYIKIIRPYGILSLIKQKVIIFLGKNALTTEQSSALVSLEGAVSRFVTQLGVSDTSNA